MRTVGRGGFTLIEIVIVVALMCVLAAVAVPMLLRAKQSGNQASAIGSLRTINSAQHMYAGSCGGGFFAPDMTVLGTAPAGSQPFISPELGAAATVIKSGYSITMGSTVGPAASAPASCNGQAAGAGLTSYWATATPTLTAGDRAYGTNISGTIYEASQLTQVAMTDATAPAGATPLGR